MTGKRIESHGVVAEVTDMQSVPLRYLRVEFVIDESALRCALNDGVREIPGMRITERLA